MNKNNSNSKFQKAIIFDMDETLISIQNAYNYFDNLIIKVLKILNKKAPTQSERDKLWRDSNSSSILVDWNINNPKEYWNLFDKIDYIERKKLAEKGLMNLRDDVIKNLKKLKKRKNILLLLATNTPKKIMNFQLKKFKIKKYFKLLFALGENQEFCKPNALGLIKIKDILKQKYDISSENIFLLGDSLEQDVVAGKSAAIKTIYINRSKRDISNQKIQPDFVINSLDELYSILDQ